MLEVVEPGNLRKEEKTLVHEKLRCNDSEGDEETGKTEEKNTLLQNEDPKPALSAERYSELNSMGLNNTEMNSEGQVISSKLFNSSDIPGIGDSGYKKRKKSKKSKHSEQKVQNLSLGMEDAHGVGSVIPLKPRHDMVSLSDHFGDETNEKHEILFQNEKAKISKVKALNTPVTDIDKDADNACVNHVEIVPQIQVTKIQEDVEGSDYKVKKKSKKNRTSAKNLPEPMANSVDPALPFNKKKGESNQTTNKKNTRLGRKGTKEPIPDSLSEAEKDIGTRIRCSTPCAVPGTNEPSEVPLNGFAHKRGRLPQEAEFGDGIHSSGSTDKVDDHMEVSQFASAKISYIDNLGPRCRQHEVTPDKNLNIKDIQIEMSDKGLRSTKKTEKNNVYSLSSSPGLQKSLDSNDNQGFKGKPWDGTFDVVEVQVPMPQTDRVGTMVNTHHRKTPTTTGNTAKDPSSCHEKCDSIPHEASKTKIVVASAISNPVHSSVVPVPFKAGYNAFLKENSADWDASSSTSESPDVGFRVNRQSRGVRSQSKSSPVAAMKASSKKIGKVLNNSSHQKSLFATAGMIFSDISGDSSEDEDDINNSDTSTRSPSDSASSNLSEYLEETNFKSQNALYGGKRKERGGEHLSYSRSGGPAACFTLDMILKSSSSYKKAKLIASRSQFEETGSQPVDFVLDSLADP